jgi:hypothetical protein
MFDPKTTALLRAILEEVCADVAHHETGKKALVASKILESASKGDLNPDT